MSDRFSYVEGGIVAPAGFVCAGVSAGLKKSGKRDVAIVAAKKACPAAAVFTTNSMAAAPVELSRAHIAHGIVSAVVTNSGNANACTGAQGMRDAQAMAQACADALGVEPSTVIVASTGVIGVALPVGLVTAGIAEAAVVLNSADGSAAAEAIMTTDTFLKQTAVAVEAGESRYVVGGMAKGSGMIMPNMATMLGYVTTDAPLTSAAAHHALHAAVKRTFNRISVDSDTSTNDMVVLMASGAAGGEPISVESPLFEPVAAAIEEVCRELSRMIVRDGEGATKFITVTVRGAASEDDAHEAALSVANSPLFKTAIFGGDANWGRVVMAVGKSSAQVDPHAIEVIFAGITTCKDGTGFSFDEAAAATALGQDEIDVIVDLHLGDGQATILTCDLSYDYVRINGEYRT